MDWDCPLLINPPVMLYIHLDIFSLSLSFSLFLFFWFSKASEWTWTQRRANLPVIKVTERGKKWHDELKEGGRRGGRKKKNGLLLLLHNLVPISDIIQWVFSDDNLEIWGCGANPAALHFTEGLLSDNFKWNERCKGLLSRVPIKSHSAAWHCGRLHCTLAN